MQVVYAPEVAPPTFAKSIFLAGPSPRKATDPNWRVDALAELESLGYDGVVFVPLPRDGDWSHGYDTQVEWEHTHLNMADVVVFWVPRSVNLPGLTTNIEYGMYFDSGKAILGYPDDATQMRYLDRLARQEFVPVCGTLAETLRTAVDRIGSGATRTGGERSVPLHIWNLDHFQGWYTAQRGTGNRLDGAQLLWSFRVNKGQTTFAFTLRVNVYVASENRNKTNEFVFSRPDISTIVAYRRRENVLDTDVVLIREFRAPARTLDGFIREVPGGSSWKPGEDPFVTASHELSEKTGFDMDPSRLRSLGARQLCGTLSAHRAHVFAVEITAEELVALRNDRSTHGVAGDSERTYVEVHRLGDLLTKGSDALDWAMLGMILTTVVSG